MKEFAIGHGTPLANHFTSLGKASPAFQKVDTHEQTLSMYEEYLRRMLGKGNPQVVTAMEEIAQAVIEGEQISFSYGDTDEIGHHEVIEKLIQEALG